MTRAITVFFVLVVGATFAAFPAMRRLADAPSPVGAVVGAPVLSPNRDGRNDRAGASFAVREAGPVAVTVLDASGDAVRRLDAATTSRPGERVRVAWDGRDDRGAVAPDGRYRLRVTLRRQGLSTIAPPVLRLDTTPPRPRITSIGVATKVPRPEILPAPGGKPVTITVAGQGSDLRVLLFRTWPSPQQVQALRVPPPDGPGGRYVRPAKVTWDGTIAGRPAPAGTYVAVAQFRDRAGNLGSSVPLDGRGLPAAGYGAALPGRGGMTVRYAGIQPPADPVAVGRRIPLGVDTRSAPFTWDLRRVGATRAARASASGRQRPRGGRLAVVAPGGPSGVYLFRVRSARGSATVPVAVQSRATRRPVLVVLPVMTWQGRNPEDDDGDGAPNLLEHGDGVEVERIYADGALPAGFATVTAPVLASLDRQHRAYDVTTDVALARHDGVGLAGHSGVLIAGDARWLPASVQEDVRAFAAGGGTVATLGVDSLRRQVRLTPHARLVDPTPPAAFDALGLAPARLLRGDALTVTIDRDDAGLFNGSSGELKGLTVAEPLASVRGRLLSAAVTGDDSRVVVAAVRTGKGLTIHLGLPQLGTRLGSVDDFDAQALMRNTWALLSR